jgi:hypothetical protein
VKEVPMNRLEEIKERLEKVTHLRGNKGFDAREEFDSCAEADIEYLLQRLERYEKALNKITEEIIIDSNEPAVLMGKAAIAINAMRKTAEEALKE